MSWFSRKPKPTGKHMWWWDIAPYLYPYLRGKLVKAEDVMTKMEYLVPDDPAALLRHAGLSKYSAIDNKRNCVDYVWMFKSYLSENELGHVLAGVFKIWLPGKQEHHMTIGFLDLDIKEFRFGDPQIEAYPLHADAENKRIIAA